MRLERLRENAQRLGLRSIRTEVADAVALDQLEQQGQLFDRVLLDVPCSGLGTLGRHADARWSLKAEMLAELVELQRQMLQQGAKLLAPGGRLVYATCTLHPAENQGQIQQFLQGQPQWQLLETEQTFWPDAEHGGREDVTAAGQRDRAERAAAGPAARAADYDERQPVGGQSGVEGGDAESGGGEGEEEGGGHRWFVFLRGLNLRECRGRSRWRGFGGRTGVRGSRRRSRLPRGRGEWLGVGRR